MGKVTIVLTGLSTVVLLVTFGKGMSILHGGEVLSHLYWSVATLLTVLAANVMAMIHAAQSDRIIRQLRHHLAEVGAGDAPRSQGRPGR